jgi:hypothetical protein
MKRTIAMTAAALVVTGSMLARAEDDESLTGMGGDPMNDVPVLEVQVPVPGGINLCLYKAVRDVARVDRDLKPIKEIYGAVTNPTGFAIKLVDQHVIHIPAWVNYAINPRGAITHKLLDMARQEARKQVGLGDKCAAELKGEEEPAAEPTDA